MNWKCLKNGSKEVSKKKNNFNSWEKHSTSSIFSSEHIQNEVITLTSEHTYYDDHFERNSKLIFIHLVKVLKNKKKNW